ncbi:MAG: hypothetical protein AB8C95_08470 [Phycisphaeraceae bacterium]
MGKRFVVVGGATAVAGLVLGASIVFGPPGFQPSDNNLPSDIGAPDINDPTDDPDSVGINIQGFDYTTFEVDSDGQLRGMRLRADRTNLKPQGITQLIKPNAEIRLGPQRAITITADKADMEMEDGKPRRGQFTGNVVVTIAEAPLGTELILDTTNAKHKQFIQQRIYMDQATDFSIEDDTINTAGPVHVTSAQVDFFGIGLRLAYNTQRERIEQLIITQGRYLIVNPEANAPGFNASDAQATADTTSEIKLETNADTDPQQPLPPKQFYAATFKQDVIVRDGIESELAGQTLTIDFSLGTDSVQVQPINRDTSGRLPRVITTGRLVQAEDLREGEAPAQPGIIAPVTTATALPFVVIPSKNLARTLLNHNPARDIVVTWTGELSILPHATRPQILADEQDAHITLQGPNAYAQTTRNGETERLETDKLEYLVSEKKTTAYASDDQSLRILSTALGGEITGTKLIVRQNQGTATILGPGQLSYTDKKDNKTLNLTWQNRLDLELYTSANTKQRTSPTPTVSGREASGTATNTDRSQTKILGVKTATFDGDVTAKHTDFDLAADTLTLAFAKPDKQKNIDNTPTAINASGSVAVRARGDAEDETFDITSGRLSIDLKLDSDQQPYAAAIRAVDDVSVNRPGSKLTCNRISVELNPPPEVKTAAATEVTATKEIPNADAERSEAPGTPIAEKQDRFAQVRSILAVGQVRALLDDEGRRIDLIADQLIADVEKDKLTLASDTAERPAEVTDLTTGRKLTGQLIEMDDQAQQLDITGPGSLATVIADPNKPEAGIEDAFIAIDWTKSMAFNNLTGEANFRGNVRSESRRSIDTSELTCDELTMQFSPEVIKEEAPAKVENEELAQNDEVDNQEKEAVQKRDDTPDRQIRSAVATGNVKFLASAWEVDQPNQISNRIRLEGPKLVITNQPEADGKPAKETLLIDGQGRMVFEDYRAPDKEDANNKATMTGRGATLFSWNKTMTLDALSGTATLLGTVQMVHLPKDENGKSGDSVQLDCNKLVADMTDTGGMSVWLSDNAPDAQIESITATDTVRLLQQGTRSMRGDRLVFEGKKNLVTLDADDNRDVTLEDLERDTATRTNKITWDLTTDRIEIDQLRGGVTPLN